MSRNTLATAGLVLALILGLVGLAEAACTLTVTETGSGSALRVEAVGVCPSQCDDEILVRIKVMRADCDFGIMTTSTEAIGETDQCSDITVTSAQKSAWKYDTVDTCEKMLACTNMDCTGTHGQCCTGATDSMDITGLNNCDGGAGCTLGDPSCP